MYKYEFSDPEDPIFKTVPLTLFMMCCKAGVLELDQETKTVKAPDGTWLVCTTLNKVKGLNAISMVKVKVSRTPKEISLN